jgi:hypothetical protein
MTGIVISLDDSLEVDNGKNSVIIYTVDLIDSSVSKDEMKAAVSAAHLFDNMSFLSHEILEMGYGEPNQTYV